MFDSFVLATVLAQAEPAYQPTVAPPPAVARYYAATQKVCPAATAAMNEYDQSRRVVKYSSSIGNDLAAGDLKTAANTAIHCATAQKGIVQAYLYVFADDALSVLPKYVNDSEASTSRARRKEVLQKALRVAKPDPELQRLIEGQLDTLL